MRDSSDRNFRGVIDKLNIELNIPYTKLHMKEAEEPQGRNEKQLLG